MKGLASIVAVVVVATVSATGAASAAEIANEGMAPCAIAKKRVHETLKPNAGPVSRWRCDFVSPQYQPGEFYVLGLRGGVPCPSGVPCSNLIGWFAVRKKDSRVYEWDISENVPGNPL